MGPFCIPMPGYLRARRRGVRGALELSKFLIKNEYLPVLLLHHLEKVIRVIRRGWGGVMFAVDVVVFVTDMFSTSFGGHWRNLIFFF